MMLFTRSFGLTRSLFILSTEPESGKGNVNTVEFVNQARGDTESVARPSLFTMNEHAIANVYLDLIFLLRIIFVKNILLQISCCA